VKKVTETVLLPGERETSAIAIGTEKTAALCYDRIWSPSSRWRVLGDPVPDSIRFYGGTAPEVAMLRSLWKRERCLSKIAQLLQDEDPLHLSALLIFLKLNIQIRRKEIAKPTDSGLKELVLERLGDSSQRSTSSDLAEFLDWIVPLADLEERTVDEATLNHLISEQRFEEALRYRCAQICVQREISRSLAECHQIQTANVYGSEDARARDFTAGDRSVVVASLEHLGIVDERALTWDQIMPFRKDPDARRKYKRFLHWLDKDMMDKSVSFIEDEISIKLEDYEKSLKKHGIKTVVGTISEVLDGKYFLGSSSLAAGLSVAGHPTLGLLVGAGLIVGRIAVRLSEAMLSLDEIDIGEGSQVSWVYEAKRLRGRH
jgi:hypothetical protein